MNVGFIIFIIINFNIYIYIYFFSFLVGYILSKTKNSWKVPMSTCGF